MADSWHFLKCRSPKEVHTAKCTIQWPVIRSPSGSATAYTYPAPKHLTRKETQDRVRSHAPSPSLRSRRPAFCLSAFISSEYFIEVASDIMWPFITGFFHSCFPGLGLNVTASEGTSLTPTPALYAPALCFMTPCLSAAYDTIGTQLSTQRLSISVLKHRLRRARNWFHSLRKL